MKKRMLLTTFIMTLVLLMAVTTATFAWYEVSSSGYAASLSKTSATVSTVAGIFEADAVTLKGKLTAEQDVALTDNVGDSYIYVNGLKVVAHNDYQLNKIGDANLSIDWPELWEIGDDNAQLAYKLSFAGNYKVTISGENLRFYKGEFEPSISSVTANTLTLDVTISADDGSISIENGGNFYFAVTGEDEVQRDVVVTMVATMSKAA